MIAFVAVLSVAGVAVMLWYLIKTQQDDQPVRRARRPVRRTLPPDDDPDFLAEISRRAHPEDK